MLIRFGLAVAICLLAITAPASGHVFAAGADIQLAQTFASAELTVLIRQTDSVPGPLHVDLIAYEPVGDLTVELAVRSTVDNSSAAGTARLTGPGTHPVVLNVQDSGPHELRLQVADEVSILPFQVAVPQPEAWELVVYGGFGATGLLLACALIAGRKAGVVAGGFAVVVLVIAATVGVLSPQLGQQQAQPGRPYVQALVGTAPAAPARGWPTTTSPTG